MQKEHHKVKDAGITLVAISYDPVEVLAKFTEKHKVTFPLLSDPNGKTIAAFGLTNKELAGKKVGKVSLDGIPYPGTMVLDKQGVIRAKLFFDGYKERQFSRRHHQGGGRGEVVSFLPSGEVKQDTGSRPHLGKRS